MRESAVRQVAPGDRFGSLTRTIFGERTRVWEVQTVQEAADGIAHAILHQLGAKKELRVIAVNVLLDRRFYWRLPSASTAAE